MQRAGLRAAVRLAATKGGSRSVGATSKIDLPEINNEPLLNYAPGSPERKQLEDSLVRIGETEWDIPCIVGGKEYRDVEFVREIPHDNKKSLCKYHYASVETLRKAIDTANDAQKMWRKMPFQHRMAIWLKAADLIATKYRGDVLAATMLGQSKTVWQAEIDAAVETIDFLRFDCKYAEQIYGQQPISPHNTWNFVDYRPLEGFVLAITPFNFTAIGIHLPTAPALMGNTVVWKPRDSAILSNYLMLKIFEEAGLPPGVINMVPCDASHIVDHVIPDPSMAAVSFTGSTRAFSSIWHQVGSHINTYRSYPRLVGETGGKNFHLLHMTADVDAAAAGTVRSAFEYQGQKCSACSRVYVPRSLWPAFRDKLVAHVETIKMGDVTHFENFMGAVIDEKSFRNITNYLRQADKAHDCEVLTGGYDKCDDSKGWFVPPTIVHTTNSRSPMLTDEIFGPVLTCYVFEDDKWEYTLDKIDNTSCYALTGSIWCKDRDVIAQADERLKYAAGNWYVNDKCTGSIVAQQPFGGARSSGTNDKAGSLQYMTRWVSPRSTKETFVPSTEIGYPSMQL
eukprot:Hpha_TRINITY_DN15806_c1_g2::TRINITY_DN15806_c1_g2_i1::g.188260::m.188260/K00294/E1.2.1.88; 1-pyrroline-5-carboxylate dehydrogenase